MNHLFDRTKAEFAHWLQEQTENVRPEEIEEVFATYMYRDMVALHREYDAPVEVIGEYVKQLNDYIEFQLGYIHFQQEFETIKRLDEPRRTRLLSDLMDKIQGEFQIPLLNNDEWNVANQKIIELYRAMSAARDL